MARTQAEVESDEQVHAEPLVPSPVDGSAASAATRTRHRNAFKLTDKRGQTAYLWWDEDGPVVECEDRAFRRRILRALNKPIWVIEDEKDEFGVPWSTRVLLQPDDPRYPIRLVWHWGQIGLGNLASIEVVRRDTHQLVQSLWSTDEAAD